MTHQAPNSSEDGEKRRNKKIKIKLIKLKKLNKFNKLNNDEKKASVKKEGKAQNHHGKPEKIVGATQKFGELYFYIKFENKTKPVFVRAEGNWRIFWLLIKRRAILLFP